MSTISRRAFLKTVGIGALSVAALSVLAGCDGTTQQPIVDNSVGTINATQGMTYVVGDYAVAANFNHLAMDGALDNTLKGYVSNYDADLMIEIADIKYDMQQAGTLPDPLSSADVADILSDARDNLKNKWGSDYIVFSFDITNFTTEDITTDVMRNEFPTDADALEAYTQGSSWGTTGIVSSKIVTASTGSCAIWMSDETEDAFDGTSIKAAVDEKTGVTARFNALVLLPRDWTSTDIKITVPGASKAVVYSVTRDTVDWNEVVVSTDPEERT